MQRSHASAKAADNRRRYWENRVDMLRRQKEKRLLRTPEQKAAHAARSRKYYFAHRDKERVRRRKRHIATYARDRKKILAERKEKYSRMSAKEKVARARKARQYWRKKNLMPCHIGKIFGLKSRQYPAEVIEVLKIMCLIRKMTRRSYNVKSNG